MTTSFVSRDAWPQLTKAVRGSRQRCHVAVAYFGKGASRLLPLRSGSRLVVDASERAVTSGQTCPDELRLLVEKGVAVFSVPNLHAKVFVVGRAAYIGSTNVSNHSAGHLVEAPLRTTEASAVRAARDFVVDHCLHEMTPELLRRLQKLYRSQRVPGGKRKKKVAKADAPEPLIPRVLLAQLELEFWPETDQRIHDAGLVVAKKRREHSRSYELASFREQGQCAYGPGDVLVQVTDEGSRRVLVTPPGNVLYVRTRKRAGGIVSFVYVEMPQRRRRSVRSLASAIGCPQKRLLKDGLIRDKEFARALLSAWAESR